MSKHFPLIEYEKGQNPIDRGTSHGEEYRKKIGELFEIRLGLMLDRVPLLKSSWRESALAQWEQTVAFSPRLGEELMGIVQGSGLNRESIAVLNNYTDFRDLGIEQGCSTVQINTGDRVLAGQTWDMHRSAEEYVCAILVPGEPSCVVFSLLGCVGMMGVNSHKAFLGVNNLNTLKARTGIFWPVLVREALCRKNRKEMVELLKNAPVTSGHNYLVADPSGGEHWEIAPAAKALSKRLDAPVSGAIGHTNHCLAPETQKIENPQGITSTSKERYNLLQKKMGGVRSLEELRNLLGDHDNYPRSICCHYESGAQDPSFTCGGGAVDIIDGRCILWKGCREEKRNYGEYTFILKKEKFIAESSL